MPTQTQIDKADDAEARLKELKVFKHSLLKYFWEENFQGKLHTDLMPTTSDVEAFESGLSDLVEELFEGVEREQERIIDDCTYADEQEQWSIQNATYAGGGY